MIWNRYFFKAGMNCDIGFWRAKHPSSCAYFDKTNSELTCSLFPPIFNAYLRNICARPGRRFGNIKPLTLVESQACLKEPRCVFVPRSWFKSAVNLAIEEHVSQAVESRNASSKTKHPSWTYGSFAKLWRVSVFIFLKSAIHYP